MSVKIYLGWLYIINNGIEIQYRSRLGGKRAKENPVTKRFFTGKKADVEALAIFDKIAGEKVKVEETPLGYRVYKEKNDERHEHSSQSTETPKPKRARRA